MTVGPAIHGPKEPLAPPGPRRPGSVRRTSTVDTTWPDGLAGEMHVHGRARDVRSDAGGDGEVVAEAELRAVVAADRTLVSISSPDPRLQQLVGTWTFRGFRSATREVMPDLDRSRSPLRLLIDDLPPSLLVSGFAVIDAEPERAPRGPDAARAQLDICAGWAGDSPMVRALFEGGTSLPLSAPAPPLDDDDDPLAWHDAPLPEPTASRRRRLLDVGPDAGGSALAISAFFRDSHLRDDGVERSFHEYAVDATVDPTSRTVIAIEARPGVLPWSACPGALPSAGRVVGTSIDHLRAQVRAELRGTSTCTHLNDVLAAIGDTPVLIDLLHP